MKYREKPVEATTDTWLNLKRSTIPKIRANQITSKALTLSCIRLALNKRTKGDIMKYRKRPIVIEAFQMTRERRDDTSEWPNWLHEAWNRKGEGSLSIDDDDPTRTRLVIRTLEGVYKIQWNDWIIPGIKGDLYACRPDTFEATYDPA